MAFRHSILILLLLTLSVCPRAAEASLWKFCKGVLRAAAQPVSFTQTTLNAEAELRAAAALGRRSAVGYLPLTSFDRDLVRVINRLLVRGQGAWYGVEDASALNDLLEGRPAAMIFLIVHQSTALQFATAKMLGRPEFASAHRMALASEHYPLQEPALWRELTLVHFSTGGEISDARINASEIHLAGGFCSLCLTSAVLQTVRSIFSYNDRTVATLVLHTSLSYDIYFGSKTTLSELRRLVLAKDYEQELTAIVTGFLPPDQNWQREKKPGFHFKNAAGQKLEIAIVE